MTREPLKALTSLWSSRSARAPTMRAALSSSSGHIISSDDTGENSFQREIVDRALPLCYILTDLEQRDEPFSDIRSTAYYNKRRLSILVVTHVGASRDHAVLGVR